MNNKHDEKEVSKIRKKLKPLSKNKLINIKDELDGLKETREHIEDLKRDK